MAPARPELTTPVFSTGPLPDELLRDAQIDRVLAAVRGHLGLEIAFVSRYVGDGERELTHVDTDLDLPMGPGFREPVEESYCWHILQGRLPELIQDPADHPLTAELAITDMLPVGCHLNVPLRLSDGSVWGSFCALGRKPDRSLGQRDLKVVHAFASLAAERIEQAMEGEMALKAARERVTDMLDGSAITIFHQPIHALDTGEPVGVECLARFPNQNRLGPDAWFDDAEQVGLGVELEMAAVRAALDTIDHLPAGIYATVNVAPSTIMSGMLEAELEKVDTAQLVIEVTEHQQVADFGALAERLVRLKEKVRIAIDDVGTGYSGLRHIVDLKPDMLKMDMALTREIDSDPARRALTGALVQLARDIGCLLVAEGIETQQECDTMTALGVACGQGYFFSRPLPVVAAQQYLMGNRAKGEAPDRNAQETRGLPEANDQPPARLPRS
ncbi:sensor domain-containing phosphodiesterase [Alteraurantiacibacter aquimixticola]|uniref:EAL domain-containing protein n=1 Tax=Alteraurantiacibacter aquimixticola TaxID=2489173 RepID=A0A4T3F7W5_9SPHN|nr:EAL domain-containing protein [Alteraurantiacibacter aquimixticola]TIX51090.1 EAL domain-containing protein [Alteraurantiacibacter aquimixticola]